MAEEKSTKRLLKERWEGQEERIQKIIESARKKEDWTVHLEGLPFVDEIKPRKGEKLGRDLRGADLRAADLRGADLSGADLSGANLMRAKLSGAKLLMANLSGALLVSADLSGALLVSADLNGTGLSGSNLIEADLIEADLSGSNLSIANFENADVTGVQYTGKELCRGIRVATCYGSPRFKRFAQDQDYLEELKASSRKGKWIYWLWLILADCGRSPLRWALWSLFLAIAFAVIYYFGLGPGSFHFDSPIPQNFLTFIYYSVVTFTTLGFGDLTPKTNAASVWVMAEVIMGYVMLGGLISIFATKLARRS